MKHLTMISLGLGLLVSMLHNTSIRGMEQKIKELVRSNIETFKTKLSNFDQENDPYKKMQNKLCYLEKVK